MPMSIAGVGSIMQGVNFRLCILKKVSPSDHHVEELFNKISHACAARLCLSSCLVRVNDVLVSSLFRLLR